MTLQQMEEQLPRLGRKGNRPAVPAELQAIRIQLEVEESVAHVSGSSKVASRSESACSQAASL